MRDTSADLGPKALVAARYGEAHPREFGGVWADDGRLQVGFTKPGAHEAPLRDLLGPLVDVVAVRHTAAQLRAVCEEVLAVLEDGDHLLERVGVGSRTVHVGLRADGEPLARELLRRYGDAVEVTVGRRPYPRASGAAPAGKRPYGPTATTQRPDLELAAVLDTNTVRPGQNFRGRVTVRNTGQGPATLSTDEPLTAVVIDQHGRIAGTSTGGNAGTGIGITLGTGEATGIDFYGGTAGVTGYTTAPGEYRVVIPVPDHATVGQLLTPPIALHITADEPPP